MDSLDYWHMCDDLNVIQCILLILGKDPKTLEFVVERETLKRPEGYEAVSTAVKNAVLHNTLPAKIRVASWERGTISYPGNEFRIAVDQRGKSVVYQPAPDWFQTTVAVEDLKVWLESRNIKAGFFFLPKADALPVLDPDNEHYAPKLAAALEAWQAVTKDTSLISGRSPKSALTIWLNRNAARFDLVSEDGTPFKTAIEEVSKMANWDMKGGAPKTPVEPTHPSKSL